MRPTRRTTGPLLLAFVLAPALSAAKLPREYLRDVKASAMARSDDVRAALDTLMQDEEFFDAFVKKTRRLRPLMKDGGIRDLMREGGIRDLMRDGRPAAPGTSLIPTGVPLAPGEKPTNWNVVGASPNDDDWIQKVPAWRQAAEQLAVQYAKIRLQQEMDRKTYVKEIKDVKAVSAYAVMTDGMKTTGKWQITVQFVKVQSTIGSKIIGGLDVATKVLSIGFLKLSDLCGTGYKVSEDKVNVVVDLELETASDPEVCWIK